MVSVVLTLGMELVLVKLPLFVDLLNVPPLLEPLLVALTIFAPMELLSMLLATLALLKSVLLTVSAVPLDGTVFALMKSLLSVDPLNAVELPLPTPMLEPLDKSLDHVFMMFAPTELL